MVFPFHHHRILATSPKQEELGYLKSLWDMVAAVVATFADWNATLWGKISVEGLVEECKRLTKESRTLNKAVRSYEVRGDWRSPTCVDLLMVLPLRASAAACHACSLADGDQ